MKNKQSGFSLIEVAISFFILMVMVVLYGSALNLVGMSKKLRNENYAYHIAGKQMENLRAIVYESLPPSGSIVDPLLAELPSGAGSYTVIDYPGYAGLKEITVTVTWNDGVAKEIEVKTLAGTGGINP